MIEVEATQVQINTYILIILPLTDWPSSVSSCIVNRKIFANSYFWERVFEKIIAKVDFAIGMYVNR